MNMFNVYIKIAFKFSVIKYLIAAITVERRLMSIVLRFTTSL